MNNKMWAVYMMLSHNMWWRKYSSLTEGGFDENAYHGILEEMSQKGFNTVVLDVGDGVKYTSHPEISLPDAWDRKKVSEEIKRAADLGIKIIPKLNFSTTHDMWLGEYERMISTKIYYNLCRDLIEEVYEIFEGPEYIHLGMDEETEYNGHSLDYIVLRKRELIWHDINFYLDCVRNAGATPWLWADYLFDYPEEFRAHIKPDNLLLSPWQYASMYEEHFTPIANNQRDIDYYWNGRYKGCGFTYIEDEPLCRKYREEAVPGMIDGYSYVPTVSNNLKNKYNTLDTLRWFKEKGIDDKLTGFMTAPWVTVTNREEHTICMDYMKEARDIYYPEK